MEKFKIKFDFDKLRKSPKSTLSNNKNKDSELNQGESPVKAKSKTGAERSRRFWQKWKDSDQVRDKNLKKCSEYRQKIKEKRQQNAKYDESMKKKERERKAEYRRKLKEKKAGSLNQNCSTEKSNTTGQVNKLQQKIKILQQSKRRSSKTINKFKESVELFEKKVSPHATRKRAQRLKKSLPKSPRKWASTVAHILRNASPRKKICLDMVKKGKKQRNVKQRQNWRSKVETFFNTDRISRKMPNKRDVLKVDGEYVAKRHLLLTKREAFLKFIEENPSYPFRYTTFRKTIPRYIKKMNLKDRRVCVCMKCFNLDEKIRTINQLATKCKVEPLTLRSLYRDSLCSHTEEFPDPECIDNTCPNCVDKLKKKYKPLIQEKGGVVLKYVQWEQISQRYTDPKGKCQVKKVWQQTDNSKTLSTIFDTICNDLKDFKGHIFRNDYQYCQQQRLATDLLEDHAIVYADFAQNYSLEANDEIQTAHYVKQQVTIHTMYLIRHAKSSTKDNPKLTKESIAMISDDLKHSASSVYVFTLKLFSYMRDNPEKVGLPKVLHRITDNCGFEYKCKQAFAHLLEYGHLLAKQR